MARKLSIIFILLFLFFGLAYAESQQELKQKLLQDLNGFLQSFSQYRFSKVLSLGDYGMVQEAVNTNFDIEIDPNFKFTGKYYPGQARMFGKLGVRDDLIILKDEPGRGANVVLYHEMLHHLINRKKLNLGCLEEETYMQLVEDRYNWLRRLVNFEKKSDSLGKESDPGVKVKALRESWKPLEDNWKEKKGIVTITYAQNLSGPYEFEDADGSCGTVGAKGHIDPDFIKKVDSALGINIDINKIRDFYEKEYSVKLTGAEPLVEAPKPQGLTPEQIANLRQQINEWQTKLACIKEGVAKNKGSWVDCNSNWMMRSPDIEIPILEKAIRDTQARLSRGNEK